MKKAEQLKQQQREIKAKTLSETLLQLSEQHKNLQAKINPLGKVLENITASTTIFKNNPILEFTKQRRQLYDSLQGSHWTETIIRLNNIYSKIDLSKWNLPNYKPLYEYGLRLQEIQTSFTTPEIVKSFQSLQDLANSISEAKAEAENNFWHNITVEDLQW